MNNCPVCGEVAEADWVQIPDSNWCSYFIGCQDDLCDTMLSVELPIVRKQDRQRIEQAVQTAWNSL